MEIVNKSSLLEEVRKHHVQGNTNDSLKIEFADPYKIRVRKVISRSNCRVTYKHSSFKVKRMVHGESSIERDAFILFDVNPEIIDYTEQPAIITYKINGESYKHYPDVLVKFKKHYEFIEIKSDSEAKDSNVIERTNILQSTLPIKGFSYSLLTESEIRKEPRLSNSGYLLRHGFINIEARNTDHIDKVLRSKNGLKWSHIVDGCFGREYTNYVCNLILKGMISINIDEHLNSDTTLFLNTGAI